MTSTKHTTSVLQHAPVLGPPVDHNAAPSSINDMLVVLNHLTHRSIGQGLGTLPTELVIEIFAIGLALAARDNEENLYLARISSLCQYWRSFVFSVPGLWTKICWKVDARRERMQRSPTGNLKSLLYDGFLVNQAKAYLARSHELDVDVTIMFVSNGAKFTLMHLRAAFFQHLHRCRSLRLVAGRASSMVPFLPIPNHMPRLQTLEIFSQKPTEFDHFAYLPEARVHMVPLFREGKCAPALRTLHLKGEGIQSMTNFNVVSPNLQSVHLDLHTGCKDEWFFPGLGGILGPDSTATTLDVRGNIPFFYQMRGLRPPIHLPNITSLRIGSSLDLQFRHGVRLPNLRHLELVEPAYVPVLDPRPPMLLPLLHPAQAAEFNLKSLTLRTQYTKRTEVLRLYTEQPSIEELTVDTERCKRGTLEALFRRADSPDNRTALPALKLLRLRGVARTEKAEEFLYILMLLFFQRRPQLHVIWEEVEPLAPAGASTPTAAVAEKWIALFLDQYPDRFKWERRAEEERYK